MGKAALQCSTLLNNKIVDELNEFKEKQREERRQREEVMKKVISNKKRIYDHMIRVRDFTGCQRTLSE